MAKKATPKSNLTSSSSDKYTVVARRYRPQAFNELVGQTQVAQGLTKAIDQGRVGHAYLFTGARGIGKTSTARIFAKALNCQDGPAQEPCNKCSLCEEITAGSSVDVLEIDGASNRSIDDVRELRSNAHALPIRCRYKIYIIDEVHMLTREAFNALLKILEEPPSHVIFMFCTTDPERIPITVLSRCQRFDFPPIENSAIVDRLQSIVATEGLEAEEDALQLLARRANGSMRDSQSLLEQLLSFSDSTITVADVHLALGTIGNDRLTEIAGQIIANQTAAVLEAFDQACREGIDSNQLIEQLLGYFRDVMAAIVGCDASLMRHSDKDQFDGILAHGDQLGLESTIAMLEILTEAMGKMSASPHVRTIAETALVRLSSLEKLDSLESWLTRPASGLTQESAPPTSAPPTSAPPTSAPHTSAPPTSAPPTSAPPTPAPSTPAPPTPAPPTPASTAEAKADNEPLADQKKNDHLGGDEPAIPPSKGSPGIPLEPARVQEIWQQMLGRLEDMTVDFASSATSVAISAPNMLVVGFPAHYTLQKESCERPDRRKKIELLLADITGQTVQVTFELLQEEESNKPAAVSKSSRQVRRDLEEDPLIRQAMEVFDAEMVRVETDPGDGE
jgi:DNA polymerase-3 subunit gamma/tau